jgi:antitoxin component YwqK of YwqJK toxin-antitoxin module
MNKSKILLLSLTFLFLFSGSVFGEGKKEYYDNGKFWSKGPLKSETPYNGMGTGWYETGQKEYEVNYKNGYKDGIESWWYKSGRKQKRIGWKNGNAEGLIVIWFESGQKKFEAHYKNGKQDGIEREWVPYYHKYPQLHEGPTTYRKLYETHYKDGLENGVRIEWNNEGRLTFKGNFVNGAEEIK